jgi:glycosyltransferase involved in cell wall biosynthesis
MYWLISLFALEACLELFLCGDGFGSRRRFQTFCCVVAAVALGVATVLLSIAAWKIWIWALPASGYRLINILRVYKRRLPREQLRIVTLRASSWLLTSQLVLAGAAWAIADMHLGRIAVALLAVGQLLAAVVLLRTSVHTWRHAMPVHTASDIRDRDLPSLSILVPARNESEQLDACLQALVATDYPKLEIVVLDDCSVVRQTPEIIRSFAHAGVRFIHGDAPDENRWLAKNWAYEQLVREANGDLLLFCGVDALFDPKAVRQLVETLQTRGKDMLSVLPLRAHGAGTDHALLQIMRYYWEICLPRRLFKRPPVLSTCWLIKRTALDHMGGMESVSRSVSPEAHFARQAVVTDAYSFIRSDEHLGVYSNKPAAEQYGTTVRVRYPQLHRRLELVALTAAFELTFLLGPFIALCGVWMLTHTMAYVFVWATALVCLLITYGMVSIGTGLANPAYGWIFMPVAFVIDMVMLHVSFWKYEFGTVDWKGRNVCIPIMRIEQDRAAGNR